MTMPNDESPVRSGTTTRLRDARRDDAAELARLFTQLGHATSTADVEQRWAEWTADGARAIVAESEAGPLVGLVTFGRMRVLHRPHPVGRVTSLVVDERLRGEGIGRRLVARAESELAQAGCRLIEVTSNLRRVDAHAFYEHIGYARTSLRLAREVDRRSP